MIVGRSVINRTFFKYPSFVSIALNKRLFHTPSLVPNKYAHSILRSQAQIRFTNNQIVGLNYFSVRFNHQEAALNPETGEQEPNNHIQKVRLLIEQNQSEEAFQYFQSNVTLGGAIHLIRHCVQIRTQQSMDRGFEIYNILTTNKILPNSKFFSQLMNLCNTFNPSETLKLYKKMEELHVELDNSAFSAIALAAFKRSDAVVAKKLAKLLVKGVNFIVLTADCKYLLSIFAKFQFHLDAYELASWMEKKGVKIDIPCYIHLLKACAGKKGTEIGNRVHSQVMNSEFSNDPNVLRHLSEMLLTHSKTQQSFEIFKKIQEPGLVAYNRILTLCLQKELFHKAIEYFEELRTEQKLIPNKITYTLVLSAIAQFGPKGLEKGKQIHQEITTLNLDKDIALINPLIQMYGKCGEPNKSIELYDDIINQKNSELKPDFYTFANILSAISYIGPTALEKGKQIHQQIITMNLDSNEKIIGSLIQMYGKCGDTSKSFEIYEKMISDKITPNPVVFTNILSIISNIGPTALEIGKLVHQQISMQKFSKESHLVASLIQMYNKCGQPKKGLETFEKAEKIKFFKLDKILLNNALTSVSLIGPEALEKGKQIHQLIPKLKFNETPIILLNALTQMYNKCGEPNKSFEIYDTMIKNNSQINQITFLNILKVCSNVGPSALQKGKEIHQKIIQENLDKSPALIDALKEMYEKCENATTATTKVN